MWLILILISSVVCAQCADDAYCNDNIACTQDVCFHGYCNYTPLNDTCFNSLCYPGHCKVLPYMTDTCGCFSVITGSNFTFDSIVWNIAGIKYVTLGKNLCINTDGLVEVDIAVWDRGTPYTRRRDFFIPTCEICTTNSECDDNSNCTIDRCINNECVNMTAYLNGSPLTFEDWKRNCCKCH